MSVPGRHHVSRGGVTHSWMPLRAEGAQRIWAIRSCSSASVGSRRTSRKDAKDRQMELFRGFRTSDWRASSLSQGLYICYILSYRPTLVRSLSKGQLRRWYASVVFRDEGVGWVGEAPVVGWTLGHLPLFAGVWRSPGADHASPAFAEFY